MRAYVAPLVTFPAVAEPEPARIDYTACPACGGRKLQHDVPGLPTAAKVCRSCDAVFGEMYLGDSYQIVLPLWVEAEPPADRLRYYDFLCLGSAGLTRRHGWYDRATRRIVQTG